MPARPIIACLLLAAGAASAAPPLPMPARRQGLWQTTVTAAGMPGGAMTMRECSDPARDRASGAFASPLGGPPGAKGAPNCSRREVHKVAGGWAIHTVCATAHGSVETLASLSGDFQSRYHVVVDARAGGQMHHMTMDWRWVGACKPGTPPVMVLPNGKTISLPSG